MKMVKLQISDELAVRTLLVIIYLDFTVISDLQYSRAVIIRTAVYKNNLFKKFR